MSKSATPQRNSPRSTGLRSVPIPAAVATTLGVMLAFLGFYLYAALNSGNTTPKQAAPFPSGGLGLSKGEWDKGHKLDYDYFDGYSRFTYDRYDPEPKNYEDPLFGYSSTGVEFWYEGGQVTSESPISYIGTDLRYVLSYTLGIPNIHWDMSWYKEDDKELFHKAVRYLLPVDAELLETKPLGGQFSVGETYYSKLLETRYLSLPSVPQPWAQPWSNKKPGIINVMYGKNGGGPEVGISAALVRPPYTTPTPLPTSTPTPTLVPLSPAERAKLPTPRSTIPLPPIPTGPPYSLTPRPTPISTGPAPTLPILQTSPTPTPAKRKP